MSVPPTLHLIETSQAEDFHTVDLVVRVGPAVVHQASLRVPRWLGEPELNELRWYLEDFKLSPFEPAPQIAGRTAAQLIDIGQSLFASLLEADRDPALLNCLRTDLAHTRIEIEAAGAAAIAWDLMRDPETGAVPAVHARALVRRVARPHDVAPVVVRGDGVLRLLLVVSRPGRGEDVPFQSVSRLLMEALERLAQVEVKVLRPATLARLAEVVQRACDLSRPFTVVHFDGHGSMVNGRGCLAFENPDDPTNVAFVRGSTFGSTLARAGIPLAILNACRSASSAASETSAGRCVASQSFAEEVMACGLRGVVAMQYNAFVTTACKFVGDLYTYLGSGYELGETVTRARSALFAAAQAARAQGAATTIDDWLVPVVYQAEPASVMAPDGLARPAKVKSKRKQSGLDSLPAAPPWGFHGRDAILLALDRVFDSRRAVFLHGVVGSGKTATAAAFARWYKRTAGIQGAVLYTACAAGPALPQLMQALGVDDPATLSAVAQRLSRRQGLWVIDDFDRLLDRTAEIGPVSDLLKTVTGGRFRVLLTTRMEGEWASNEGIALHAMPEAESLEVLHAVVPAARVGDPTVWRPLLDHARGNPLALVTLAQAARTRETADRTGLEELVFQAGLGLALAPGVPSPDLLETGYAERFAPEEWRALASVIHRRGYLDVEHLVSVGTATLSWHLPELEALTAEWWKGLLHRAAMLGLLMPATDAKLFVVDPGSYYEVHPLLPYLLAPHLDRHFSPERRRALAKAFVIIAASVGKSAADEYREGSKRHLSIKWLSTEERDLLHALHLVRLYGLWELTGGLVAGLATLYDHTGRRSEWHSLVAAMARDVIDPETGGPIPGRELAWRILIDCRIKLARQQLDLQTVERLWALLEANEGAAMDQPEQAMRLWDLGQIREARGDAACLDAYTQARDIFRALGNRQMEAVIEFDIGRVYHRHPSLRNLRAAMEHYERSQRLHNPADGLGIGRCVSQMAQVAMEATPDGDRAGLAFAIEASGFALKRLPHDSPRDRAIVLHRLGVLHRRLGRSDEALTWHREALHCYNRTDDPTGQGDVRFHMALALQALGRPDDSVLYARAAEQIFAGLGPGAAKRHETALALLGELAGEVKGS